MTLEALLDCSAAELTAMSDADLTLHFAKYFDVTRPERVVRITPKETVVSKQQDLFKSNAGQLAKLGINLDHLFKKKGKR